MRLLSIVAALAIGSSYTAPTAGRAGDFVGPLFVSPSPGCVSSSGVGSAQAPLCSLADAFRIARNRTGTDKTIILRGGTHRVTETLHLGPADSGLVLRAYAGEQATVSGGVPVSGWVRDADGVWRAPLPADLPFVPRQLYVDGVRATRTVVNATVLGSMNRTFGTQTYQHRGDAQYQVEHGVMSGWRNPDQIEMVYTAMQSAWTQPRCGVRNISADGRTVTMAPCLHALPGGRVHGSLRWFLSGLPATIENVYERLRHPGEFYVDTSTTEILYIPRQMEDMATADTVVPAVETLIHSVGVSHLTIEGLSFEHTGWAGPSRPCGYVPIQAGQSQCANYRKTSVHSVAANKYQSTPSFVLGAGGQPTLAAPSALVSESGDVKLTLQMDGNLCVHGPGFDMDWCASQAHANNTTYYARVQTDGNVCIGDGHKDIWCLLSKAFSTDRYFLLLSNDGSVCVHRGTFPVSYGTLWCSPDLRDRFENPDLDVEHIPGGVRLNHTWHSVLRHCSFRRMGGAGLDINGGSQHTQVQGCWISDISGSGLQIGGNEGCPHCPSCATEGRICPRVLSQLMDFNLSVTDTVINDVAQEYMGELGVWTGFTRRLVFAHNTVCRTNWGSMSFGGGGGKWRTGNETYQGHNEVSWNRFSHWMLTLCDSGATYFLGPHPNSSHHHNHCVQGGSGIEPDSGHSTSAHGGAWYTDSGSAYWDIHSNVAEQLNGGMWMTAWDPATTHHLAVHGNFADTTNYKMIAKDSVFFNNTFVNRSAGELWPTAATMVREGAGVRAGSALPEALHACDNSVNSYVPLSGCSALPIEALKPDDADNYGY